MANYAILGLRIAPFVLAFAFLALGLFGLWQSSCDGSYKFGSTATYSCSRTAAHGVNQTVPACAVSPHHFNVQKVLFSHNIITAVVLIVSGIFTNWGAAWFKSDTVTMIKLNGWHIPSIDLPLAVQVSGWVLASALMLKNVCYEMLLTTFIAAIVVLGGALIAIHMARFYAYRSVEDKRVTKTQYWTNYPLIILLAILLLAISAALVIWIIISWHANSGSLYMVAEVLAAFTCVVIIWIFAVVVLGAFGMIYNVGVDINGTDFTDTILYQYLMSVTPLAIFFVMGLVFLITNSTK